MEESNKLPLKRVELSLTKFNEVAIPHHLDLLRQHKANIIKYSESGEYGRVRAEQTNAKRVASQLRSLVAEMEALRRQLRGSDLPAFDRLTQRSRDLTLRSIMDYLDTSPMSMRRRSPEPMVAGSAVSSDSVGLVRLPQDSEDIERDPTAEAEPPLLQLQLDEQAGSMSGRAAVLRGWTELHEELRALHDTWRGLHAAAMFQREQVGAAAGAVDAAADNVVAARAHLSLAERLRGGAWIGCGAVAGAVAGGPVGLAAGAKAGAAAAVAGSLLAALAVRLLARRRGLADTADTADTPSPHKDKDE